MQERGTDRRAANRDDLNTGPQAQKKSDFCRNLTISANQTYRGHKSCSLRTPRNRGGMPSAQCKPRLCVDLFDNFGGEQRIVR
jgi:hypothetical protein